MFSLLRERFYYYRFSLATLREWLSLSLSRLNIYINFSQIYNWLISSESRNSISWWVRRRMHCAEYTPYILTQLVKIIHGRSIVYTNCARISHNRRARPNGDARTENLTVEKIPAPKFSPPRADTFRDIYLYKEDRQTAPPEKHVPPIAQTFTAAGARFCRKDLPLLGIWVTASIAVIVLLYIYTKRERETGRYKSFKRAREAKTDAERERERRRFSSIYTAIYTASLTKVPVREYSLMEFPDGQISYIVSQFVLLLLLQPSFRRE